MNAPALPDRFASLRPHRWTEITIGRSGAAVWRVEMGTDNTAFLKVSDADPLSELPGEARRLEWLASMGFKAPRLIELIEDAGRTWLLMSAVPGADLTHLGARPDLVCRIYAQGLKRLHALDPLRCPFDHALETRLAAAADNLAAGRVDETDFDEDRKGATGAQLLDWLRANQPPPTVRVVTHGDASLPNIMARDERFSGVVDCGRLGVADQWQDLALACRSIAANCGKQHIASFLHAYGAVWSKRHYEYYCTLDEFF